MKRLKPLVRKQIASALVEKYWHGWTCEHGAWNRDKLMKELISKIKEKFDVESIKAHQRKEVG